MATDQLVAGLLCTEVLADLSEYLDGGLPAARRAQFEAHIRGCDNCERFGRRFASTVQVLREQFGPPPPLDPALATRLRDRLRRDRA